MNSKYKRLIGDIGIFALGALGSKLISFLLLPLYTHVLTDAEYGIADLVFTLGQLLLPFISLAIFNGLLRFGLMRENSPADTLNCATRVFAIGSIVTLFITPLLGMFSSISDWKWYLSFYVISSFAVSNTLVYLKVKDKNKLYALMSILQTLTLVVCNIIFLVVLKRGIQGYLISYIISNCITAAFAFVWGHMLDDLRHSKYQSALMKMMVVFSLPYILNDISWWVIHSSNKLMIEVMLGSAVLGIFTTASKIPSLINVVASIFTQAWGLSSIKEYDSSNDTKFYSKVFNYFIIIIFGACICIVTATKIFMRFFVSEDFFSAWQYIPLLLLGAAFSAIASFMGALLGAMKKSKNLMITTLIASIVNVLLSFVMIRSIGVWGAVTGTLSAHILVAICRMFIVHKHIKIDYSLNKFIPLSVVALLHALLVGLDYYILFISITAIVIYISLVNKEIIEVVQMTILLKKNKN